MYVPAAHTKAAFAYGMVLGGIDPCDPVVFGSDEVAATCPAEGAHAGFLIHTITLHAIVFPLPIAHTSARFHDPEKSDRSTSTADGYTQTDKT